ncbi:MAG: methylmalonyl Co-A mutase-associated GTPase MeaB [Myxococcales bacterium]|nr:methylmalonyl Co-A mutase-associated GTPase MeaB [Myxococcales bacterium]
MSDPAERILTGCHASAGQVIRWIEDGDRRGVAALKHLYPHGGHAHVIGITGPPGAGKSTLVDALIAELRGRALRVGVLAVDPSSPFSQGAVLGDRVRMQRHSTDPQVFIRSMATRGCLGGLARATSEAAVVLAAMGQQVVLVETVGVGQDEVEVAELAHTTVVVSVPGLGDEVQALKAGILEVGDVFAINKADHPGCEDTEKHLRGMLAMRAVEPGCWQPPLLRTVAHSGEGVPELADACIAHRDFLGEAGRLEEADARRGERVFRALLGELCAEALLARAEESPAHASLLGAVRAREIDPYSAAESLVSALAVRGGDAPR